VLEAFTGARRRVEAEVPSLLSTPPRVCEIVLRGGHLGVPRVPARGRRRIRGAIFSGKFGRIFFSIFSAGFLDFPQVFSCSDGTDAVLERYLT
jgi:hypothetical protein